MRTYVSHLKISKTPRGDKNEFSKNISKDYIKMKKNFIQFFKIRVLAKKRPLREAGGQKKQFLKNIGKGDIKKGSTKGTEKNGHGWSLSIGLGKIL